MSVGITDTGRKHGNDQIPLLPPKTFSYFVDRMIAIDPSLAESLGRFSRSRYEAIERLQPHERENLVFQKEALGLALEIAGIPRDELLAWRPRAHRQQSFLDGLPEAEVREDTTLLADFSSLPGFDAIREATHFGAKVFEKADDPAVRMTVIMANRTVLERQTGADLIYFNEAYRAFIMVQYKAMEKGEDEAEFRWQPGDQFVQEIARMEELKKEMAKIESANSPDGYRFSYDPFFFKFCPRVVLNPDDRGLFKGIYLPLELFQRAEAAGMLKGKRGGNLLTFGNIGRRINNTEFVNLVTGAWVGTSIEQSTVLEDVIRQMLASNKTVTLAVKHKVAEPDPDESDMELDDGIEGDNTAQPETDAA